MGADATDVARLLRRDDRGVDPRVIVLEHVRDERTAVRNQQIERALERLVGGRGHQLEQRRLGPHAPTGVLLQRPQRDERLFGAIHLEPQQALDLGGQLA
jgi:hypothetical protein